VGGRLVLASSLGRVGRCELSGDGEAETMVMTSLQADPGQAGLKPLVLHGPCWAWALLASLCLSCPSSCG
jgi:hypothetical protein